ncbi:Response regulator receiver (CheY) modulated Serine phosphatase [Trichormus variabilis ATCC 29413]|uniref:Response regulator receiver (CheY) modulated Serine phosphatase n=3 Tax=Anabaena variabilis TaxID=264691 RepID=Q3MCU7_TRIV2|nr:MULTISPECIES: SpoIIE family protein phosphatase [Nostocaceae]ABA21189.1 Response regulator receiver (CheY) modulated Serine phosphatase [Trichormus variabilis ATCC 29413]MBC1214120.1 SpoIIE family protein phosphatase [Trichormus variabilis ARAD]MBC1258755.1 SpoIIE family protein phosphatase [Trichormus variabilis V5]MBC1304064.1 SpoIIE family protein phosphatase [Trichormus variabilis N2B]MBC1313291.1 SpoIIE family protein phosphatase [Trichormus variabilis PNB]
MVKILVIDDDPVVRTVLKRTLENQGYETTVVNNGEEGIIQAKLLRPALIICDWVMSGLDGLEVCRQVKANPELATSFFILLTAKGAAPGEEKDRVKGLDAGADEFISKPIEMIELKARVRAGLRLHQLNQDLQIQKQTLEMLNHDLQTQKQTLEADLAEAADYVRSLLPKPLEGKVNTETLFIPSTQLGGDCFDYYWLDDEHLAIYLLDVSGHGIGSALLSVSILNILRSQSLPNTNFYKPREVLKALNHAFQMANHGDKYFTIWYGVYHCIQHQLVYASAGHPPAVILSGKPETGFQVKRLNSLDLPIGFLPDVQFEDAIWEVKKDSTLYIFSDGIYEIREPDGKILGLDAFIEILTNSSQKEPCNIHYILMQIMTLNIQQILEDDLSLLKITLG